MAANIPANIPVASFAITSGVSISSAVDRLADKFADLGQTEPSFSQGASVYDAVGITLRDDEDFTFAILAHALKRCNRCPWT